MYHIYWLYTLYIHDIYHECTIQYFIINWLIHRMNCFSTQLQYIKCKTNILIHVHRHFGYEKVQTLIINIFNIFS